MIVQGWPYATTAEVVALIAVMGSLFLMAALHELVVYLQYRQRKRRWHASFFAKKVAKKLYTKGGPPWP